jgi:Lrp/AsnC family transcriptional regulator
MIMPHTLDSYERKILALLQEDSSLSTAEISERIGLSVSPCWRRIDRLLKEGFITRRVALIDRKKVGLNAHIVAQVKLSELGRTNLDDFTGAIRGIPEVLECYVVMGVFDFILRVVTKDIEAYERLFFDKLSKLPGVQEINSTIALSEIKATTALPL